ncbi:MAG: hypothetical protein V1797_16625 [Pseudomonadota bacterium]
MFSRQPSPDKIIGRVGLRMVAQDDQRFLTSLVPVGLSSLGKKGAELILDTPFIDGSHVLMDVHNITPKLAMVVPLEDAAADPDARGLAGEVVRFNRLDQGGVVRFLVEVAWVTAGASGEDRTRLLKRLAKPAHPEAN